MSIEAMNWAWKQSAINGNEKLVLLRLADVADDKFECFPSYNYLAKSASVSRSTALRIVKKLIDMGYLKSTHRNRENGSNTSNIYRLNVGETDIDPSVNMTLGGCQIDTPPSSTGDTPPSSTGDTPITTIKNHHKEKEPDKRLLPGNCQKPNPCRCTDCKTAVQRLLVNHKKKWAEKQYFDCPSRTTLLEHWARWETDHTIEAIVQSITRSIEKGEYRPRDRKQYTTAIDAAICELDFEEAQA